MKKIIAFILLLCMVLMFAACTDNGNTTLDDTTLEDTTSEDTTSEITMQEICDANQTEEVLKNHQSLHIQYKMDGEVWYKKYLTAEYVYEYFLSDEFEEAQFMTDNASYAYSNGSYLCYLFISPDGVTNDFANDRATRSTPGLSAENVDEIIESVSEKDGRITVKTYLDQDSFATEEDLVSYSCKNEYVLDAQTYEVISIIGNYTYEDGTVFQSVIEVTYDTEEPEMLEAILKYANQTEDMRNVTIVSNPGTEKEISQNFRTPKGMIIGFSWDDVFADKVELYTNAACTEAYDPYVNVDSDLTVYVKWIE